jgi:ATP-dependent RNA helicase RhlE
MRAGKLKDSVKQFDEFNLSAMLKKRLQAANFIVPTPVQAQAIPPALEGRDILATAQTGTGKTLSFLSPILDKMARGGLEKPANNRGAHPVQVLILLPTRELAMQVLAAYQTLEPNRRAALVVGGLAEGPQLEAIRRGGGVLIATPGRLEDYLDRKLVDLGQVQILVLDEVDRMLDMGFRPAIRRIAGLLPRERQTLCYSATLDGQTFDVAKSYLRNPVRVEVGSTLKPAANVKLRAFEVPSAKKQTLLEHLLQSEQGSFLVFVRTKHGADRVADRLSRSGWKAARIHGNRSQAQRTSALRSFAEGENRVLVATDVAARGIDVSHVAHVVNFDLPKVAEDFVHRIGRTGRAERHGVASTFADPAERNDLQKIEKTLKIRMERFRVRETAQA